MFRIAASFMLISLLATSVPAFAADGPPAEGAVSSDTLDVTTGSATGWRIDNPGSTRRPAMLPALYVSLAVLQVADIYTTSAGLKRGAVEANPAFAPAAGNTSAMIAMKVASTAGAIACAEKLWKKNRVAAAIVMTAVNGATAAIAARNTRIQRAQR